MGGVGRKIRETVFAGETMIIVFVESEDGGLDI